MQSDSAGTRSRMKGEWSKFRIDTGMARGRLFLLPYCPTALLPYCPTALLPYCPTALHLPPSSLPLARRRRASGPLPRGREALTENRSRCEHRRTMTRPRSDSPALFDLEEIRPDFSIERRAMKRGQWPVAGLDEAGRGPLAGPVVAAAVILDPKRIPKGLDDSKRLTAESREELFEAILKKALAVSFASCSAETIDRTDIRKASLEAMRRAAHGLALKPAFAITDGLDVPAGLPCPGEAYVKGDRRSHSIAAASIVA